MKTNTKKNFLLKKELDQWAIHYSALKVKKDKDDKQWLIFSLGHEKFSILVDYLDEIATIKSGVSLKNGKTYIMGLINLRGETIVLADLGRIIGIREQPDPDPNQRILVVSDQNDQRTGFLVDNVEGISSLDESKIQEYVGEEIELTSKFIQFIGENRDKPVSCIDVPAILSETWK